MHPTRTWFDAAVHFIVCRYCFFWYKYRSPKCYLTGRQSYQKLWSTRVNRWRTRTSCWCMEKASSVHDIEINTQKNPNLMTDSKQIQRRKLTVSNIVFTSLNWDKRFFAIIFFLIYFGRWLHSVQWQTETLEDEGGGYSTFKPYL